MNVVVVEYDPAWPQLFAAEAVRLKEIFGDQLIALHHIGSTSVPGLMAKPIIDMLPIVRDIQQVDALNEQLAAIGYEAMGECGLPGRRYFRKGGDNRTHQIHAYQVDNSAAIDRHLAFRDYLRTHPEDAKLYAELKVRLAKQFPQDIFGYMDGKDSFIKHLEQQALQWYRRQEQEAVSRSTANIPETRTGKGACELKTIYLAGGCFWGVEEFFKRQAGVVDTTVGYANGDTEHPTYEQVCRNNTGHAETLRLDYDEQQVTLEQLLQKYWSVVDPTVLNRQGHDTGRQYRTGIYYVDEADLDTIRKSVEQEQAKYRQPIVTEVEPLRNFFDAEEYHQDYLRKNPGGYCHIKLN